jgi:hypothetical protein
VEEHTAPSVPPDAQPQAVAFPAALGAAVGEAFDAYSGARRLSWRKIAEYIAANYPGAPWDDGAIRWWCDRIRKERNRAAWIAGLPSMTQKQLTKLDRWCERLLEEGPDGPRGRQYYAAKWQAPYVAQELASERRRAALERVKIRPGRRPAPVQPWTELDATPLQKLTQVDAMPPLLTLVDAPDQVTQSHTLTPAAVPIAQPVIVPQDAVQPVQDGAKTEHIRVERGAPLGAVCSSLPACPMVPEVMMPAVQVIRPYVPVGGWTPATIAALPGVICGNVAADDPWIAHNRALAATAVQL